MPQYTLHGPFVDNSAPGIDHNFLNAVETQIQYVYSTYNLGTPYLLLNSVTANVNVTNTYTCTGVGSIPSGATGVWIAVAMQANTIGNFAQFAPHGGTLGQYPSIGTFQVTGSSGTIYQSIYVPVTSNQIDLRGSGSGTITTTAYIFAYVN